MTSTDPLKRKCTCGNNWYFSKLDYMKMILFGKLIVTCKDCGRKHHYRLIYHAVEEFNETRIENNEMETRKKNVWRQG